ncbi:RNA uridylyltransferase [Malassezia psittaci]|uniref:polynucleotide adenylyltransferase n=1 Tax=Malassezia psittaci TaxID=1821823 RepID=A0AAF0JCH2_9BASI|nr:RNA uridylyltransferase [Malassezia psittaci]
MSGHPVQSMKPDVERAGIRDDDNGETSSAKKGRSGHNPSSSISSESGSASMAPAMTQPRDSFSTSADSPTTKPRIPAQGSTGNHVQTYERHTAEISRGMLHLLKTELPTEEEYRTKEATRRQLEQLAARICPGARLLAFGSMANGFALRNSDMDLCCILPHGKRTEDEQCKSASEMVEILGELIRKETDFHVLPLPKARIPIIKMTRRATNEVPYDIACDIGFDNHLALENTRLLLSYATLDPHRLRAVVLFIKVWTKRRKLNSPFTGTLSSYGYTLLVLFYFVHVKRPALLPNLQRMPSGRVLRPEETLLDGCNVYFYDDIEILRKEWQSPNSESIGELLLDFFRYFSRDYNYAKDAVSLHTEAGLVSKESRGWSGEHLCIEDPFQHGYNVSRTVTRDGLYTIRGEFMRAGRLLSNRSVNAVKLLEEICEEREDNLTRAPDFPSSRKQHEHHSGARSLPRYTYRDDGTNPIGSAFGERFRNAGNTQGVPMANMNAGIMNIPYMPYINVPQERPFWIDQSRGDYTTAPTPGMNQAPPNMSSYVPIRTNKVTRSLSDNPDSHGRPQHPMYTEEEVVQVSPATTPTPTNALANILQNLSLENPDFYSPSSMLPYDAPYLTNDDYYVRAREFRAWLEDHDRYLDELNSEDSHRYFSRFVRRWNDARLPGVRDTPINNLVCDSVRPPEPHLSASDRQYEREKDRDAAIHAAKQKQKNERREAREWAEEQAPRATGRDAVRERRQEKAASNRAMAERKEMDDDVGDNMSSDALFGLGNSFQDAIAERDRAEHKRQSRTQERRLDKDASLRERRAALQAKEAETMAMLKSLAQQRFA